MVDRGFKLFDSVVLKRDYPGDGLRAGDQGAIVEVLQGPGGIGYMVEFADDEGRTLALPVVLAPDLELATGQRLERSKRFLEEVAAARAALEQGEGISLEGVIDGDLSLAGCPAIGVGGFHSDHYADPNDGVCQWCGMRAPKPPEQSGKEKF